MEWSLARPRGATARRGARIASGSLPRRPAGAQRARRAPGRAGARRLQSRHARRARRPFRRRLPASARRATTRPRARGAGTRARRTARADSSRRRGARALHAGAAGVDRRQVEPANDQHPSFVPPVVRRCAPVRAGARARGEGDRRHRALRDPRARRRTDHRPAGAPGLAPRRPRTGSSAEAATSKPSCSPRRCDSTSSTA